MKTPFSIYAVLLAMTMSCASSKSSATLSEIAKLDDIVTSKTFKIESIWAMPQVTNSLASLQNSGLIAPGNSINRMNISGISNHLTVSQDSISSRLPYYGEVQMPSGYNGSDDNSITFDGLVTDYKAVKNKDNSYTITFDAKSNNENFNVTILMYTSLQTEMILNGAKRFSIRYSGELIEIEK
ncbi:MAG: DUF4251 domain-containing protein [Psychroserpens sp.]|uniref:DUF4251 domain-containing protein n=1 Tax=Psychroserpens sp. TaxID=2020870 RepID=UPI003C7602DD